MRSGHARRWDHQLPKPRRSRVNRSQFSRADHGTIHGRPPFLVITLAQWMAHSRRRIAVAGIAFLIAMIGVASCILGGLYLLFRATTLPMKRKSAASGSWCRTGSSFHSSSEPSTSPVFVFTTCAWAHARHVIRTSVRSSPFFGGHQPCVLVLRVSIEDRLKRCTVGGHSERPQVQDRPVGELSRS